MVSMTTGSFISAANINTGVNQLSIWLTSQAINVPAGWIDACVAWLAEEHGGIDACGHLTKSDWCQLIYEQWLHSDLKQLACPVLPSTVPTGNNNRSDYLRSSNSSSNTNDTGSHALKLDGELCLQVVNLFNIGESFYGQLRRYEGNLSVNLPPLEVDGDENPDGNATQMTQAVSQYLNQSTTQTNNTRQSTVASCVTLILTDGVHEIKAIEFGSRSSLGSRSSALSFNELSQKFRPGVKIRLRGPLLLRNNVLLVPPGAIQSLSSRQLEVLGGEVDELLEKYEENTMNELGKLLANKLNIPLNEGSSLPSWFPRITPQVHDPIDGSLSTQDLNINDQPNHMSNIQRTHQDPNSITTTTTINNNNTVQNRDPLSSNRFASTVVMPNSPELWDDETFDDAILSHAAQSLEKQLNNSRSGIPTSRCQSIPSYNDPLRLPNFMAEQLQTQSSQSEMSSNEDSLCTKRIGDDLDEDGDDDHDPFLDDQVDPDILASALADIDDHKPVKDPIVQQPIVNVVKSFHSAIKVSPTPLPTVATASSSFSSSSSSSLSLTANSFTSNQPLKVQSESKQTLKQTLLNLYTRNEVLTKRGDMDAPSSFSSSSSSLPKIQLAKPSPVESAKLAIIKPNTDIDDSEDLLPPAPKRKPIELKQNTSSVNVVSASKSNLKDIILRPTVSSSGLSTMLKTDEEKWKTLSSKNNNDNNNKSSNDVSYKTQTAICQPITISSQTDYRFQPFCYIQDMYHDLLQNNVNNGNLNRISSVYRIRGLLISLLSSLEHHHGTKWTLAVRITDGSAIVDLDVSSELLTEWIGLSPQESESLRQMSRLDPNSSSSFTVQEAQKHRQRLRTALTNFQGFLSHLGGLFTITAQQSSTSDDSNKATTLSDTVDKNCSTSVRQSSDDNNTTADKAVRPLLIGYSELDHCWLRELQNRVYTCYSDKKFIQKLKNVFH
uniref:RecQ-mediated genome instability protein 1 n=1 Tax=Trichobilharzia regenti TaxID=157069 RepID=A0AA85JP07_TRIRE|nr:unnamed protein product [Trichobilharzia regenti]